MTKTFIEWLAEISDKEKKLILNEQKQIWCWKERLFYLYSNGVVVELQHLYQKNGFTHYKLPRPYSQTINCTIVARIICKTKVDYNATLQNRKLTYKK